MLIVIQTLIQFLGYENYDFDNLRIGICKYPKITVKNAQNNIPSIQYKSKW